MAEYFERIHELGKEGLPGDGAVHKENNNKKFNRILNQCRYPQRIYATLMALVEPSIEQADDVLEKRKVIIRDLFAGLDIPQSDKQVI